VRKSINAHVGLITSLLEELHSLRIGVLTVSVEGILSEEDIEDIIADVITL
jgi:hypothetical protein